MTDIEDFLKKNDFQSIVVKQFLVKTGQITTDLIFSAENFKGDISFHRDKFFLYMLRPLLDVADCHFRIKDLNKLEFNFVFTLKENLVEKIKELSEKGEFPFLSEPPITEVEQIKLYKREINENNIIKFIQVYKKIGSTKTAEDFLAEIEIKLKNIFPFEAGKISLDMWNILRIIVPDWSPYLLKVINIARKKVYEEVDKKNKNNSIIMGLIEDKGLYWNDSKKELPVYSDFITLTYKEVFSNADSDETISKNEVNLFFRESSDFFMFKIKKIVAESSDIVEKFEGNGYKIYMSNEKSLEILENGKPINFLTISKTQFFHEKIKKLVIPEVTVFHDPKFKENVYENDIYVIYKQKFNEIIEKTIYSKDLFQLKVIYEILKNYDEFKSEKIKYEIIIYNLLEYIENMEVEQIILSFVNKHKESVNFIYKILNILFSKWKEKSIEAAIQEQKSKIENISKEINIQKNEEKDKDKEKTTENYNMIQIAINIINNDFKGVEIREILLEKSSNEHKVNQIINLYKDIGSSSKAFILKTEKSQEEFLNKIKEILKKM
ncbi:MAG TPA: hypothetical protein PK771_05085 [Spirochaetota bacterium]|nr:hypothetical protein [Spirochaetota bacterium]